MNKKEELFVLINSLSKSEKRYFTLYCSQLVDKNSNYLRLFEAIEKKGIQSDKEIRMAFAGEKFLDQLHVIKNYLKNLILKSLRNFYASSSKEAKLSDIMRNVPILFQRELYSHCKNELTRARRIAETIEKDTALFEIHSWERKLAQTLDPSGFQQVKAIVKEQKKIAERIVNSNQYWDVAVDLSLNSDKRYLKKMQKHPLLQNPETAQSIRSKILYYHSLYYLGVNDGNTEKAKQLLVKLIEFMEEKKAYFKEDPDTYISTINNYVAFLIFEKKPLEAIEQISKIKGLFIEHNKIGSSQVLSKQLSRTLNIELEIYKDLDDFESHEDIIRGIEKFIDTNRLKIPSEYLLSFWFQLSSIYFSHKNYSRALYWINQIIQAKNKEERIDLLVHGRMLNLLIHFELQNFFGLGYFIESTKRFISKYSQLEEYQSILLNSLNKMSRMPKKEIKIEFDKVYETLFLNSEIELVSEEVLDYIDYKRWIKGKIK